MYRTLRICSNSGAYEALPEGGHPIDLARARRALEKEGIAVVDARVMLIAALDVEVTISRNGRLLFKTKDLDAAERTFVRLRTLLDLDAPVRPPSSGGPGPAR
jgi:hypothetical protein